MQHLMLDLAQEIQADRIREAERARRVSSSPRKKGISQGRRRGVLPRRLSTPTPVRPVGTA
jgi:hypothetical protein